MRALIFNSYDEPDELSEEEQANTQSFLKTLEEVLQTHFRTAPVALEGEARSGRKYWRLPGEADALVIIRLYPVRVPATFDVSGAVPSVPSKVALPLRVFLFTVQPVDKEKLTIVGNYQEIRVQLPQGSNGEKIGFIEEVVFPRMAGAGLTDSNTVR